jgi:hypothetical protein
MNRMTRRVAIASSAVVLALLGGCAQHRMGGGHMMGSGTGMGMGQGMGMGANAQDGTPGWSMMTPEEREAHQARMKSATSREQCEHYMQEHQQRMADRARQRGLPAPTAPHADHCPAMKR